MNRITLILCSLFFLCQTGLSQETKKVYTNPIIHADYSDPDAIRVGDDYYMISSSFNHVPAIPILHSRDLVTWKLIGHALQRLVPEDHFQKVQHGGGVWAPTIRYFKNEFYIYYPDPDFGIYLIKSKFITGPWSDPELVIAGKGLIDPCPLLENNGKIFLVNAYAGSRAGFKSIITVRELNSAGTKAISDPVLVYDGHADDPTVEGPKFYKRNGYYYIFAPAGGVSTGWQIVLRSKNVYGPYERKVVLHQGNTAINGPHQGAWVNTKSGEDWFLHFQDKNAYGRIVHLQPMIWKNDWPVIGFDNDNDGKGEPVIHYRNPQGTEIGQSLSLKENDDFNFPQLSLQWQWQANPKEGWAFPTTTGTLRMFSVYQHDSIKNLWSYPAIIAQKLPAEEFTATAKVKFLPAHENETFGMILFGTDYAYLSVRKVGNSLQAVCAENIGAERTGIEKEVASMQINGNHFFIRLQLQKGGLYNFSFSEDGKDFIRIGKTFTAKPGKWVGAKIGFFCSRTNPTNNAGYADIDYIRFD